MNFEIDILSIYFYNKQMRRGNVVRARPMVVPRRSVAFKMEVNLASKIERPVEVKPEPAIVKLNPNDPWQVRGVKAPVHLGNRCPDNYYGDREHFPREAEYPGHPLSRYEVWRYRELERQDLIKQLDRNPKDEAVKAYIKFMHPKAEDAEFLINSDQLIESVVSKDNIITIPIDARDVHDFAEFVKQHMMFRNMMAKRTFNKLPFFETYHFHSKRFPVTDMKLEMDVYFNDTSVPAEISDIHDKYLLSSETEFYNKVFLAEHSDCDFGSRHILKMYISNEALRTQIREKWFLDRETAPVWYNHVLVIDA